MLNFIIVGTGNIAGTYVRSASGLADCNISGVISRSGRTIENLPSWPALEAVNVPYDAVIIATPNGTHGSYIEQAAKSGKHILCEKSLDSTVEGARRSIAAAKKAGVLLGVAFQHRFHAANLIVSQMLADKSFGRVFAAELKIPYFRDAAYYASSSYRGTFSGDGGGPFMQQAAHQLDIYCQFFGLPVRLSGELDTFAHDIECEDFGAVIMRHSDGMIGTIMASTVCRPGFPAELAIYSERGTLKLCRDEIVCWEMEGLPCPSGGMTAKRHDGAATHRVEATADHELLLEDFCDAIHTGREPMIGAESAMRGLQLAEMIYQNSQKGV